MHLKWLIPLLPTEGVQHYIEPFCGSAAVILNRQPAPCETINDLNGRVVNFFKVLRENPRRVIQRLKWTPYAEDELRDAKGDNTGDPFEDAIRFIIRRQMGMGFGDDMKSQSFRLSYGEQNSQPPHVFRNAWKHYKKIAERLLRVQITNRDGISLIAAADRENAFFYLDPPYLHSTRNDGGRVYTSEMTDEDHDRLLLVLYQLKGRAAISGYSSEKYESFFSLNGWKRHEQEVRSTIGIHKTTRTEVLWMNYDGQFRKCDTPNADSLRFLNIQRDMFDRIPVEAK